MTSLPDEPRWWRDWYLDVVSVGYVSAGERREAWTSMSGVGKSADDVRQLPGPFAAWIDEDGMLNVYWREYGALFCYGRDGHALSVGNGDTEWSGRGAETKEGSTPAEVLDMLVDVLKKPKLAKPEGE